MRTRKTKELDLRGYICQECAAIHCNRSTIGDYGTTMHQGQCEWCHQEKTLCHVRNYGWMKGER